MNPTTKSQTRACVRGRHKTLISASEPTRALYTTNNIGIVENKIHRFKRKLMGIKMTRGDIAIHGMTYSDNILERSFASVSGWLRLVPPINGHTSYDSIFPACELSWWRLVDASDNLSHAPLTLDYKYAVCSLVYLYTSTNSGLGLGLTSVFLSFVVSRNRNRCHSWKTKRVMFRAALSVLALLASANAFLAPLPASSVPRSQRCGEFI